MWWRRGRVELPVQEVSPYGLYVRSRRRYVYLVRMHPTALNRARGTQIFLDDALCGCAAAPQRFGVQSGCLRSTPTDVAGLLGRSEGDFSFAS